MSQEEQYEQFEAYLDKSMSEEELNAFENMLKDETFKQAFDEYRSIQDSFKSMYQHEEKENEFITNLKKINAQTHQEKEEMPLINSNGKLIFTKNLKWMLSAAAAILLFFLGYQFLNEPKQSMGELYASNFSPEKLSVERGSVDDSLSEIVQQFDLKKYQEVLPIMQAYYASHSDAQDIKLAIAIAQLELNQLNEAEQSFTSLISQNDVYKEKAQWYLAMLYLKQANKVKAIELLKQFDATHFYYSRANVILKNLE